MGDWIGWGWVNDLMYPFSLIGLDGWGGRDYDGQDFATHCDGLLSLWLWYVQGVRRDVGRCG